MASSRMPDEFFDLVSHHLPPEPVVGPKGGRPPVPHRTVLKVIWYVLASGCRWEDVLPEMGCSGRTAHRVCKPGNGWAFGITCMRICCGCCGRPTGWTKTSPLSTAFTPEHSAAARRPAPVPLTGANSAASTT